MMSQREQFQRLRQKQQQKEQQQQQQQHSIASTEKTRMSINVGPSSMTSPAMEDKHQQHSPSPAPLVHTQPGRPSLASTRNATLGMGGGGKGGGKGGHVSSLVDRDANMDGRDNVNCLDGDGDVGDGNGGQGRRCYRQS